jgi:hypothetical protein
MTVRPASALRLEPERLTADESLADRLADLARLSTPSIRASKAWFPWRLPFAAAALVLGSGGIAFGTTAVVHQVRSHPVTQERATKPAPVLPPAPTPVADTPTPSAPALPSETPGVVPPATSLPSLPSLPSPAGGLLGLGKGNGPKLHLPSGLPTALGGSPQQKVPGVGPGKHKKHKKHKNKHQNHEVADQPSQSPSPDLLGQISGLVGLP